MSRPITLSTGGAFLFTLLVAVSLLKKDAIFILMVSDEEIKHREVLVTYDNTIK